MVVVDLAPWAVQKDEREMRERTARIRSLSDILPVGLADQSFGYAKPAVAPTIPQSAYDQFVQGNQVTPPARPPATDYRSDDPYERAQADAIGQWWGDRAKDVGDIVEPISGAVSLGRGALTGDQKATAAGKESLSLFFPPEQQSLGQPRPETASELSMRESAEMAGKAFGGELPLLERLGQIPNAMQRSAELWLGPGEAATGAKAIRGVAEAGADVGRSALADLQRMIRPQRGPGGVAIREGAIGPLSREERIKRAMERAAEERAAMLAKEDMPGAAEKRAELGLEKEKMVGEAPETQTFEKAPVERKRDEGRIAAIQDALNQVNPAEVNPELVKQAEGVGQRLAAQAAPETQPLMLKYKGLSWQDAKKTIKADKDAGLLGDQDALLQWDAFKAQHKAQRGQPPNLIQKIAAKPEEPVPFESMPGEPRLAKGEPDALQIERPEEILSRQQGETGVPGGERLGMGPSIEGQEVAGKGAAQAAAQGPAIGAEEVKYKEQAQKTYAMVAKPRNAVTTAAPTQVGPHFYQTYNTRNAPPPTKGGVPAVPVSSGAPKSPGWEPMYKPQQAANNPVDVPPPGQFFKYAGIPHPELIQERSLLKRGMLEKASAGTSEYAELPHRQLQVDAAQRAKTDLYSRGLESMHKEQEIRANLGSGAKQTFETLRDNPKIEKALATPEKVPGTKAYVTKWQLAKSKVKAATLTPEETAALQGMQANVDETGRLQKHYGQAIVKNGKLAPFEPKGEWPDFSTPQHWNKMRTDPDYAEAYLKELEAVNRHYGHNIGPQVQNIRNSLLQSKVYSETEAAIEHSRDIPVHLAAFEYRGKVHEVTVFRLGDNGGYIDRFMNHAPRDVAWNHYFGQNFNALGDKAINDFKAANPNLPTPRSVIDDFAKVFREGGYLKDAEGLENLVMAMHGVKPEGWTDRLAKLLTSKLPTPMSKFFNDVFNFHVSRMTDEVGKWNLVGPYAQAKQLGGGRLWKPETTLDMLKSWVGIGRKQTAERGLTMNPYERLGRDFDEMANSYVKHGGLWKTLDKWLNKAAFKKSTENISTRGSFNQADRYFGDLEKMAQTGLTTGRRDTNLYSVGLPHTWTEALERMVQMPAGPNKDVLRTVLKNSYQDQLTKRATHINQSPMFKTAIEQLDKNPITAPVALFAREPAQWLGHSVETSRQLVDGLRKGDWSVIGESLKRMTSQGVGLGVTGSFVYFANQLLRTARGQKTDNDSFTKAMILMGAQAILGKGADLLYPFVRTGNPKELASLTSPHLQVVADYATPAIRQMTHDDADLMNDLWHDIVVRYMPGKMVTAYLGIGIGAARAMKSEIQEVHDNPVRKAKQPTPEKKKEPEKPKEPVNRFKDEEQTVFVPRNRFRAVNRFKEPVNRFKEEPVNRFKE